MPSNPELDAARHERLGPPGAQVRPRPARLPGADRPVPRDRRRGARAGCRSASCSTAARRRRPACRHREPPRLRLGARSRPVVGRGVPRPARPAAGDLRRDTWPTVVLSNHDQSRHASRLSASAGIDDTDAVARAAAAILLHAAWHAVPLLRRGDRPARCRGPVRRDHRPARATRGGGLGLVEPRRLSIADAVERASRVTGSPRAGRGSGSVTTPTPGTWPPRPPIPTPSWRPTAA